jgi:glutamate racemase
LNARAVGVFDSGVGGLSVLAGIRRELPAEHLLYVADSAHVPYGDKPVAFIEQRSLAIAEFLVAQGAKALVVACNTATSASAAALRARFSVPVVAIEPAVKPAAALTRSGVVAVLATAATLAGERYAGLVSRYGSGVRVLEQACGGWVEQVESGELDGPFARARVEAVLAPLLAQGADVLVLGCTHFPFLAPLIREVCDGLGGDSVQVVEPAPAVARELRRRLAEGGLLNAAEPARGSLRAWSGADPQVAHAQFQRLLGEPVEVSPLP